MRLNKLLLVSLFFIIPYFGFGQSNWELGIKAGAASGLCDIGGINAAGSPSIENIQPGQIRWDLGGYVRYRISSHFSLSGQFDYIRLQGFDSLSKVTSIRDRNLNYRDDIIEGSVRLEWSFWNITDLGGHFTYENSFNMYLFVGAGIFHMNPEAMVSETTPPRNFDLSYGQYVPLHTLTTEGESEYSLIQPSIPMGIGFYYTIHKNIRLGWEFCWNKTFTDYIDDVSGKYPSSGSDKTLPNPNSKYFSSQSFFVPGITPQQLSNYGPGSPRGNNDKNDSFVTTAITLGFVLHSKMTKAKKNYFFEKNNYKSRAAF